MNTFPFLHIEKVFRLWYNSNNLGGYIMEGMEEWRKYCAEKEGYLHNVSVKNVLSYLISLGYTDSIHALKRSDEIGPTFRITGSKTINGQIERIDVEMGEYLPRVYREHVIVKKSQLGDVVTHYWDHDFESVIQKDENGIPFVPDRISKWWEMVASKNGFHDGSEYLRRFLNGYNEYCHNCNKPQKVAEQELHVIRKTIRDIQDKMAIDRMAELL